MDSWEGLHEVLELLAEAVQTLVRDRFSILIKKTQELGNLETHRQLLR